MSDTANAIGKTDTHNAIVLRPPPGTRFTMIVGGDVVLQFQRGKEREVVNWLHKWIDAYVAPEANAYEAKQKENQINSRIAEEMKAEVKIENGGLNNG